MNRSYGFQLKGEHQQQSVGIYAIGHEKQTASSYRWDGDQRADNHCFVFQYTLRGSGAIRIGDSVHRLKKNEAFWIEVPSDHSYYLPDESSEWEFIYLTLFGDTANELYQQLTRSHGHILTYSEQSPVIRLIRNIIQTIEQNKLENSFQASAFCFQFLMALTESLAERDSDQTAYPKAIENVIGYIKSHYQQDLSLDDCVRQSNLSKYYFTRHFKKHVGMTPIQYLMTTRMQKAMQLLLNDSAPIHKIATRVGYQNGNYFAKVFKKYTGKSPNAYRHTRLSMPVDHWFTD